MNDISIKVLSKKRAKKAKQKLLAPERRALQAEQSAKQEQLREINRTIAAHAFNLFQQYAALR
ncbi:hypothetical protein, partial [Enterobacter hormaechei]